MPGLETNGPPVVEGYLSGLHHTAEVCHPPHASIPTSAPGFAVRDDYFNGPVALDFQRSLAQPP